MSGPITEAEKATMREISADPLADELLGHKCRWEAMGRFAVLREWGDPREWASYAAESVKPRVTAKRKGRGK